MRKKMQLRGVAHYTKSLPPPIVRVKQQKKKKKTNSLSPSNKLIHNSLDVVFIQLLGKGRRIAV